MAPNGWKFLAGMLSLQTLTPQTIRFDSLTQALCFCLYVKKKHYRKRYRWRRREPSLKKQDAKN